MIKRVLQSVLTFVKNLPNNAKVFVKRLPQLSLKALLFLPKLAYYSMISLFFTAAAGAKDAIRILITLAIVAGIAIPAIKPAMKFFLTPDEPSILETEGLPPIKVSENITTTDEFKIRAIVRLHDKNGQFFCSGSVISKNYILTASHCVDRSREGFSAKKIIIRDQRNEDTGATAKVVGYHSVADLAILQGDFSRFNTIAVALTPTQSLDSIGPFKACGFPYGDRLICNPFRPVGPLGFKIGGQGFLFPGMSGGPVLDSNNQIMAVNCAAYNGQVSIAPVLGIFYNAGIQIEP